MRRTLLVLLLANFGVFGQNCEAPPPDFASHAVTIFSPEQEEMLGDVIAETVQREFRIYPQQGLTEPLERIASRLLQYLPENPYHFRFYLIEIPDANAYSVAGGRIYVSRRLVAFTENEDELAGVIAHEMGHVITRQASADMTKAFKQVLKVTQVGGRDDIFQKFNQLIDAARRRSGGFSREQEEQVEADRVSLWIAWRAGYDLQGLPRFFDRLTENKGAKGNVLSDLFGATRPESKRLRQMIKGIEAIPAACRQSRSTTEQAAFQEWRKMVAELSREDLTARRSDLSPVLTLSPGLRPELINLKFSPDGRLLIAQDDSGVSVLRREPLEFLFRIPALEAHAAVFDRDSKRVLLPAAGTRLEIWNIESRSRERLWEPAENQHCRRIIPSPDGKVVACSVGLDEIRLLEIETNTEIGRHHFVLDWLVLLEALLQPGGLGHVHGEFSPDAASYLAGSTRSSGGAESWAFDLRERSQFAPGKPLKGSIGSGFAFIGPNRLAAIHPYDIRQSGVYSWPEGKLVDKLTIPGYPITGATKGSVVFLRPFKDYAVGALDLESKEIFQVSYLDAMDRYEDIGVAERGAGEVALYPARKTTPVATLHLPDADLGRVRSGVHSPDLAFLALSLRTRAGAWELRTGQATLLKPFDGGSISADGIWNVTFQDWQKQPDKGGFKRVHLRSRIDLRKRTETTSSELQDEKGKTVQFAGNYQVTVEEDKPSRNKATLTVDDVVAGKSLWSREMASKPAVYLSDTLVLEWWLDEKGAGEILKQSPELKQRRQRIKNPDEASLVEILDPATGKSLGRTLIEAGGRFGFRGEVQFAGRTLFMEDESGRTLAYSLDTGERSGQQFGRVLAVNASRGLVGIQNQPGVVEVFDSSMRRLSEYALPGNVVYAGFDGEGKRLLAVTGAQQVFIEEVPR